jgi:hypothetical protein
VQLTGKNKILAIGAVILVLLGIWGYQMARTLGNFGQLLGGADAPGNGVDENPRGSVLEPEGARPVITDVTVTVTDTAEPVDLRQEVLEVRREVSRVLVNDPELYASLDELFDETDEDRLRENLQILREAFLSDSADIPILPEVE